MSEKRKSILNGIINGTSTIQNHCVSLEADKGNLEIWYVGFFFHKYVLKGPFIPNQVHATLAWLGNSKYLRKYSLINFEIHLYQIGSCCISLESLFDTVTYFNSTMVEKGNHFNIKSEYYIFIKS